MQPDYPLATVLNPAPRNHSRRRRPIQWVRCLGLAIGLFGLAAACYSCR